VGTAHETAPLVLVDLRSFTTRSLDVGAGEVGLALAGDALMLVHRNDTQAQVERIP
jgi:hypothetical protein